MRKLGWLSLFLMLLAGCATISSQVTPKLQLGMTKEDVIAKCGNPTQAGAIKDKDGRILESFVYRETSHFSFDDERQILMTYVYFSDGKVIYYGGNQNIPTEQSQMSQK